MGLFRLFPPGFRIGDEAGDEKKGRPVRRQPPGRRCGRHGSSYSGFPECPWTALRLLGWRYPRALDQSRDMIARSSPSSNSISRPSGSRQDLSNLAGSIAARPTVGIGATWPFTTGSAKVGNPYPQPPFCDTRGPWVLGHVEKDRTREAASV